MTRPGWAAAALFTLLATACGAAGAPLQPLIAAPAVPVAAPSVELVERLSDRQGDALPDVTGLTVADAEAALDGLTMRVVSFRRPRGPVTAQWPAAGDPRPADRLVVVWRGTPPTAPAAVAEQPSPAATPPETEVTAVPATSPAPSRPIGTPPVQPAPGTGSEPAPGGRTPGLEDSVPPPHPPRDNIRELPPGEAGTTLSGRASWYGPGFAGHTTACGGVFDPHALTLASRELRCGTVVTVIGPSGRSVQAMVTDWGPAEWTGRRFDLSQATFAAVAGLSAGVVDVTVRVR